MLPHSWTDFLNQRSVTRPTQRRSILVHAEELESRLTPASVVSVADQTFNLAAGIAGFQVTRTGTVADAIDATYTISDGSALSGSNYTASTPGSVHFNAGQTVATIPLSILPNNFSQASRALTIDLTGVVYSPGLAANFANQLTFTTENRPASATVVDLNGDGKLDLIVSNFGSASVSVLLNTTAVGATTPTFATQATFATGGRPNSVKATDVNGDGLLDLVVSNRTGSTVSVLLNTTATGATTPSFASQVTFATDLGPYALTVQDLNNDGKPDLITANRDNNTVSVLLNTTVKGAITPTFATQVAFAVGNTPFQLTTADVNGDGLSDLIVANYKGNTLSVLLNTTTAGAATPTFATQVTFATDVGPESVTAVDLNGDGKPDLVTVNYAANTASVLFNTTVAGALTPTFAAQTTLAAGSEPYSVAAADVNGDGKADLIVANYGDNSVSVLLNTTAKGAASPTFATQTTFFVSGGPEFVTTADVNGDGQPDLIVTDTNSKKVSVLLNTFAFNTLGSHPATAVIDSAPVLTSIVATDPSPTSAGTVNFLVSFSEKITGLTANDFITNGSSSGATIGNPSTADGGLTWMVTVRAVGEGTLGLSLASRAGIADSGGNQLYQTTSDNGANFTRIDGASQYLIDRTAPTLTIAAPSASASTGAAVSFFVSYADTNRLTVTLSPADVVLNRTGTANGTASVSVSGNGYLVTISGISGTGSLGISIIAGTASDQAGNLARGAGPSMTFAVDAVPPSVLSIDTVSQSSILPGTATFKVTFSEPVVGVSAANFSLTGTLAGSSSISSAMALTPTTFQVTVSVSGSAIGTLGVSLSNSMGASDSAGNLLVGLPFAGSVLSFYPPPKLVYTALGSGPGGATEVEVYANGRNLVGNFFAFDPSFAGGVIVSTGDINGDGTPDIIVAAGAGGVPVVEVIDGTKLNQLQANGRIANSALLATFYAFDPAFHGGVSVTAAHLLPGAGMQIVVGAGLGGLPLVRSFSITGGAATQLAGSAGAFLAYDSRFSGGVSVAAGDFTTSGTDQIITGAGPGGAPQVKIFRPSDLTILQSFFAFAVNFSGGVSVAAGDVTGSGTPSIIVGAGAGGSPVAESFRYSDLTLQKSFLAYDPAFRGGVNVTSADINNDSRPDIITGPGISPNSAVRRARAFDGLTLAEISAFDASYGVTFLGGVSVG